MSTTHPMRAREKRAAAALTDVVAVDELAEDLFEVQSVSDVYRVDLREPVCECPDFQYNDGGPGGRCKHIHAARIKAGKTPIPAPESPALCPNCTEDFACFEHFDGGVQEDSNDD